MQLFDNKKEMRWKINLHLSFGNVDDGYYIEEGRGTLFAIAILGNCSISVITNCRRRRPWGAR